MLVIVGHLWGGVGHSVLLSAFGVQVFLVLSGYLITTLLQKEHDREQRIDLVDFYRRRCFRIFPAAYVYIFIIALLSPSSRPGLPYAATYTVSYHYLGTPELFQHLWSLSVEEQFYLIWPLALVIAYRYRATVAWLAMIFAALFRLATALSSSQLASFYMHYSFPGTMDSIAAGCLLAIYEPSIRPRLAWMADSPGIALALPATAWTIAGACAGDTMFTPMRCMTVFWGAVPVLIALWVFLLVERKDWILNNRLVSTIGVLSYSMYLWQQVFTLNHEYSWFIALPLLGGCAVLSYILVEKPMLRLGASVRFRKQAPADVKQGPQLILIKN